MGWLKPRSSYAPSHDKRHQRSPNPPTAWVRWSSPPESRLATPPTMLRRLRSAPDGRKLNRGHAASGKCRLTARGGSPGLRAELRVEAGLHCDD
jgi:hypothetical protein